jgi:hypothetical protein
MYGWQNLDYGKAGALIRDRDPRKYGWGYFATDTIPESEVGLFFWFESPAELLAFIANIETQALQDKEKVKKVKEILKGSTVNRGLTRGLRKQLNDQLKDIQIKWWGKFSELYSGKTKFSQKLISAYFGPDSKSTSQTIFIPKFIEFLWKYGH